MMAGNQRRGRIVVIGSSNTDLVCQTERLPGPGETVASSEFAIYPGGKAANQAVAAARCGATVSFVGGFGDDAYGRDRRAELLKEHIDLAHAQRFDGVPSGLALIAVDLFAENFIITVGGANDHVSIEQVESAFRKSEFDVLLMPNEAPPEVVSRAIELANDTKVIVNAAPFGANLLAIASSVDVLICNSVEAGRFLKRHVDTSTGERDVEELAALAGGSAIITLGADGAVAWNEGDCHRVAAPAIEPVDTTGAGDAFCGAFAAWIASGGQFRRAVETGVVAGALATTRTGAQPSLPTTNEIEDAFRRSQR